MTFSESNTTDFSEPEELSANDREPLLSERAKSRIERFSIFSASVLAWLTWSAQALADEPTPTELLEHKLGVTDLSEIDEVHQIPDLSGCPQGEDATKMSDEVTSIRSFTNNEHYLNWDFDNYVMVSGPTAFSYSYDGPEEVAAYCGQSTGDEVYSANPPEGTVLVIPEMYAGTRTSIWYCASFVNSPPPDHCP